MKLKLLIVTALLAILTFHGVSLFAEEAESSEPQTETTDQNNDASVEADSEPQATPSSDVFIPTEEISEDFAVSFPVDI
jgi:hypothetical protein